MHTNTAMKMHVFLTFFGPFCSINGVDSVCSLFPIFRSRLVTGLTYLIVVRLFYTFGEDYYQDLVGDSSAAALNMTHVLLTKLFNFNSIFNDDIRNEKSQQTRVNCVVY